MLKTPIRHSFSLGDIHTALFPHASTRPDNAALRDVVAMEEFVEEILPQAARLDADKS